MTEPGPDDRSLSPEDLAEDDLLAAVRAGETGAYAVLYRRHHGEAVRLARSLGGSHDPDDVAQEAFLKILRSILRGAGPRRGFAPYLMRVVRNEAIDRTRRRHEDAVEDLQDAAPDSFVAPDGVDELFDRQLMRTAFEGLPETWRRILWLTEVEGATPRALAPQLGRSPNAISQLSRRAREGLRAAWLRAHLDVTGASPICRGVTDDLAAHEHGRLAPARSAAVASHLETCPRCAAARDELRGLAVQLRGVLLPLVLGSPLLLEQVVPDVAALGISAEGTPGDGALTPRAPTGQLGAVGRFGLVRGTLIAHGGAVASLGAIAVLAVGGTLMLGAAQEGPGASGGASTISGGDSADGADGTSGADGGEGTGGGDGAGGTARPTGGTEPADATTSADGTATGADGTASPSSSSTGTASGEGTAEPVQLPVAVPGTTGEDASSPTTVVTTPADVPSSPHAPLPAPTTPDEDQGVETAPTQGTPPAQGTTPDAPEEQPSRTPTAPGSAPSEPTHGPGPGPARPSLPDRSPLPGKPSTTPTTEPAPSPPPSVDPSTGDAGDTGGTGGAGSVGDVGGEGSSEQSEVVAPDAGQPGSGTGGGSSSGTISQPHRPHGPGLPPAAEDPGGTPAEVAEF